MRHVRGKSLVVVAALAVAIVCGAVARAAGPEVLVAGDKYGLAFARGNAANHAPANRALLLYHNGPVMTSSAAITAIFWGNWSSPGDKITGLDTLNRGFANTAYLRTNVEYTQSGGAHVSAGSTYAGHLTDSSATPSKDPGTSGVLAEVAKMIGNSAVTNGYYPVYTDIPRGTAGYCAWHSWGSINGTQVQFAFFFKLDGDVGCDPADPSTTHSQGLEALANVSGHELSEALTDPRGSGWYDRQGAENADKCAWTFGGNVSIGGSSWKIQGNFSNAAYQANAGYGPRGCIQTA